MSAILLQRQRVNNSTYSMQPRNFSLSYALKLEIGKCPNDMRRMEFVLDSAHKN